VTRLQIGVVAGVAIIMVLAFIVLNQGLIGSGEAVPEAPASAAQPAQPAQSPQLGALADIDLNAIPTGLTDDGDPTLGTADAPVTIVEYSDYQCPHCAAFAQNTLAAVIKNYVTAGDVRYIHRDAAILGEESQWAAQAANCAAEQGHFWEYHELLFERQGDRNSGTYSRDSLKQYADELGLDTEAFNECVDSNKYAEEVVQETQEAQQRGVEGTPTFFVNEEVIPGNVPFEQMQEVIDRQLEAAS
jgi:protein-disulfide isomerase